MNLCIEIANCIIELFIVLFFFSQTLKRRDISNPKRYAIVLCILAFHIARSFIPMSLYINYAVSGLVVGSCAVFLYKDFWLKKLGMWLLYFVVLTSTDMLARSILAAFTNTASHFETYTDMQRYIGMTLCNILNLSILGFFSIFIKKKLRFVDFKYWLMMGLFPLFSLFIVICCDFLIVLSGTNNIYYIALLTFIIIGLLYFNSTVFEFIDAYSAKLQLATARELIKHQEENYKLLEINERELRKLKHDINSHIEVIKMLVDTNSVSQSAELMESISSLSAFPTNVTYTNDSTLDSILNIYCKKSADLGIKYTVTTADMHAPINFDALDKSTILCNALNNAIEASTLTNEKFILIDIASDYDTVRIHISNSSLPIKPRKLLSTTKNDAINHGFGIESIKLTLKKYNGHLKISHENGITEYLISADNSRS